MAFFWTLFAFIIGAVGCLAIFNNEYILRFTYWSSGATYEGLLPEKGHSFSAIYIGLRGYVFYNCTNTTDPVAVCTRGDSCFDGDDEFVKWKLR